RRSRAPRRIRYIRRAGRQIRPAPFRLLRLVSAIPRPRADLGMMAAGIRALVVDAAQARLAIKEQAVVVGHADQGKDARLLVEALDDAVLLQALGDVLRWLAALELVHQLQADQVVQAHLNRHGAAGGHA